MEKVFRIIIGITGASGSLYTRLLTEKLLTYDQVEISVITTDNGIAVMRYEDQIDWLRHPRLRHYDNHDFFSAPASGSARFDAMVILPCTMGTIGRIAAGISTDLLVRAADVMLKEHRPLIIVPREAPVNTIHLRNMVTLSECGAIICPASPSFYSRPETVTEACETVTNRIVSFLGFDPGVAEWGSAPSGEE